MKKLEELPPKKIHRLSLNNNEIFASGNVDLLKKKKIAIFTSQKIPLSIISPAEDFILTLTYAPHIFISGWHSPFERRVFKKLMKQKKEVIFFTPKGIRNFKILNYMKEAYQENRLLIASTLWEKDKITLGNSLKRNKIISEIADYNLFTFINKGGNLEKLFFELINQEVV